jgi:hypothetical protein
MEPREPERECPCRRYNRFLTVFQALDDDPHHFRGAGERVGKSGYSPVLRFVNMQHTQACIDMRAKDIEENYGDWRRRRLTVPVFSGSDYSDGEWWRWKATKVRLPTRAMVKIALVQVVLQLVYSYLLHRIGR